MHPYFDDFICETRFERVNLDVLREELIARNKGFIIESDGSHKHIKKEIKNPNGIFSSKFGRSLDDVDKFGNRYKCECGKTTDRINNGTTCPHCGTKVKYVDDDFEFMGFLKLNDYYVIHPNLFKSLQYFIGSKKLDNILKYDDFKNRDGYSVSVNPRRTKDEPFFGIGMIEFRRRYKEIMDFYREQNKGNKEIYYQDLMFDNVDKVFTQTIPVFTTLLRASKNDPNVLKYEESNGAYMMISSLVHSLNQSTSRSSRSLKPKSELLYDLQMKIDELYEIIVALLSGKKGKLRNVFGGRYNFSSRCVIVPNGRLKVDQIVVPYQAMVELEKQRIINILEKVHNSAAMANRIYEDALRQKSPEVVSIINQLIKDDPTGQGIPCLLNRNPTINMGSILQVFIVGICDSYTLQMPLQILPLLAADFDGDVLTCAKIICKSFYEKAYEVFNPRNSFYISKNDGYTNSSILPFKDILINSNTLLDYYRQGYKEEQVKHNLDFLEKYGR